MKKKTKIIIAAALTVAILIGVAIVYFINSPAYALLSMYGDLKSDGIDGIRPYFTEDAIEVYDTLMDASDRWLVRKLLERAGLDGLVDAFEHHSKEMEWEFQDLLTGRSRADVYVDFSYGEDVAGTLELRLIKLDGQWKIDGFGFAHVQGLELSELF